LLSSNISFTCPYNIVNFGPLTAEIDWRVWAPHHISTGIASWQRYCTASSSGHQPGFAALNRGRHLCSAGRPSLLLSYRYCMALQQRASAKLCGVVRGMELRNFCRGRHLYSAGRPSRWASAHILVYKNQPVIQPILFRQFCVFCLATDVVHYKICITRDPSLLISRPALAERLMFLRSTPTSQTVQDRRDSGPMA